MVSANEAARRLRNAEWLARAETQSLMALLDGAEARTRAVGGVVRDTLLGRPVQRTDLDLATEILPQEVIARAETAKLDAYPTGVAHGTVTLRLGTLVAEVTTLREDVETDGRRAVVRFGSDWVRDAERRDFTLNALYAGMDGSLYDPLGGLDDCLAGRVRFIGDPERRIEEDRLRVYRFFRFSASHGGERLDVAGLAACTAAADTLETLSAERVGSEFRRMLGLPRVAITLRAMAGAGILAAEPATLKRLHSYERQARRPDLAARLAILLSEKDAERLQDEWRLSNDEVAAARAILAAADLLQEYQLNEAAYRYPAALADAIEVAAVMADWSEAGKSAVMDQLRAVEVPRFPLRGGDLLQLGLQPDKTLGAELERLERLWIESGFSLDRERLLELAKR
jgi:poly(A) polymerase